MALEEVMVDNHNDRRVQASRDLYFVISNIAIAYAIQGATIEIDRESFINSTTITNTGKEGNL
jgi:ribosomal protein L9